MRVFTVRLTRGKRQRNQNFQLATVEVWMRCW